MNETDGYIRLHPVTFPGFGLILVEGQLTNSSLLSGAEVTPPYPGCFSSLWMRPRRPRSKLSIRVSPPGTPPQSGRVVLGFIPQACPVASLVLFRRRIASWNPTIGYEI